MLNYSIIVQNNINALADPKKLGQGFTIFSIEQSYLEYESDPNDAANSYKTVKACLNPNVAAPGFSCPVATIASPVVKYGDVRGTFGGSDIYGVDALDYGYPQYYNLVEPISETNAKILISNAPDSYFPPESAANCLTGPISSYTVIDANLSTKPIVLWEGTTALIPCFYLNNIDPQPFPSNDVFTYQNQANPGLAAAYDAYLMTQLPPISETINTNGATVYITFSGEPQFLGATGWTLDKIDAFNQQLNSNFNTLNLLIPGIIPQEVDVSAIKYAIWNFTSILQNES